MYNEQENPGWRTPEDQGAQGQESGTWQNTQEQYSWQQPESYEPPKKSKRSGIGFGKLVALALICSVLGGALGGVLVYAIQGPGTAIAPPQSTVQMQQGQREDATVQLEQVPTGNAMTAAQVYQANVNSTVGITTSITTNFWGYQTTSAASGSGFILSPDGYILTNYHVVEGSSAITVACYDGTTYEASLVGYDQSNDIAVLKVEATGLTPVVLGDSEKLNVGDDVVAIGNPLGELTFSLTAGKVSAMDRQVTLENGVTMQLIQTDCAINSGNSGGALFNLYGEVIGITNAKYSGNSAGGASIDNIGFAIPMNDVRGIIESIIEKGYVSKPYIGVYVSDVSLETQSYGLPQGAAVQSVIEDSPAQAAGLQANDIITHVDGQQLTGQADLIRVVTDSEVGQELTLTVYRKGQTLELKLTIGEQVQDALPQTTPAQNQSSQPGFNPWGQLP